MNFEEKKKKKKTSQILQKSLYAYMRFIFRQLNKAIFRKDEMETHFLHLGHMTWQWFCSDQTVSATTLYSVQETSL